MGEAKFLQALIAPEKWKEIRHQEIKWASNGIYVMRCAIWYHLYNLKNVENTHGGVLLLVKLQVKSILRMLNCAPPKKST